MQSAGGSLLLKLKAHRAQALRASDANGKSDPYIKIEVTNGDEEVKLRTGMVAACLDPVFDEEFHIANIDDRTSIKFTFMDKDVIGPDDYLGAVELKLNLQECWNRPVEYEKTLIRRGTPERSKFFFSLEVCYAHYLFPKMMWIGPPRLTCVNSVVAGALTATMQQESIMPGFGTYKLLLPGIEDAFAGMERCGWNKNYAAAQKIFSGFSRIPAQATIRTQHMALYANRFSNPKTVNVRTGDELLNAIQCGRRGGQMRYFTYVLLPDKLNFSETGTLITKDVMSKHAMHANCASSVVYAGEMCVMEQEGAQPGWPVQQRYRLVVDNNSGTYAPSKEGLPRVQHLLQVCFPGLIVEALAMDDPKLKRYHSLCPERV